MNLIELSGRTLTRGHFDFESWELALKAEWEDGTFNYDAELWGDQRNTFGTGKALSNTKTEAFSQLKLSRVKLVVNRASHLIFSLPATCHFEASKQPLNQA